MSGNPNFMGYQFGSPIYSVDLTDLNVTGNYSWVVHLSIGNRETVSGLIQSHQIVIIWHWNTPRILLLPAERFQYSEFHSWIFFRPADQLDDGLVMNDSGDWVYRKLTGEWHDAGDYNKYMEWITKLRHLSI